jgi:hypothetical protein
MVYLTLLVTFAVFTLLDAVTTVVGLRVGCVELNPMVKMWGIPFWVMFRILLLGCMLTTFFVGNRFFLKHFPKGSWMLRTTLFILDVYIGAVVFSGLLAICLKLTL